MNPIDRKPKEVPRNMFYGVDITDKQAVQKEYERLQKKHRKITILVIVVLVVLGIIFFDFCRVNFMEQKPIFAIQKKVDGGTLFNGLGYEVLYCENGERYLGSVLYKTCEEVDMSTFSNFIYNQLSSYGEKKKIIDKNNLASLTINEIVLDEENDEGGSDYLIDLTYECKDGSNKCFVTDKEFNGNTNNKVYIKINKYNEVYSLLTFKDSGEYYNKLNEEFTEKVKAYFIANEKLEEDNLEYFKVRLISNNGKYKFRGTVYADSYLISVDYTCKDNGNECVQAIDKKDIDGDYANLNFIASMFLDADNGVVLVGPREYFEID